MTTGDTMNGKITMLGRTMRYAASVLFVHALAMLPEVSQYPVNAQTLKPDKQSLDMIADFAERICSEVPLEGSSSNLDLSGSAEAKLNGLLKNIAALGIEGAAKYEEKQFKGFLQKDLRAAIQDSNLCRLKVADTLISKLLGATAVASPSIPPIARFPFDMQLKQAKMRIKYLADEYLHTDNMSLVEVTGAYGDNVLDSPGLYDWPKVIEALEKQGYVKINKRASNNIEFTYTGRTSH
jgi:hypothetical protein